MLRVELPELRVAVEVLVLRVDTGVAVVRVVLLERFVVLVDAVLRVELPVLRVAVAVVLVVREDTGVAVVERVVLAERLVAVVATVLRVELPERVAASERLTAVFVLPKVRLLTGAVLDTLRLAFTALRSVPTA